MYTFLTLSRQVKLGMILLIMSLLTLMPISGVNSARPKPEHGKGSVEIELDNIINLSGGGMAYEGQILAFGTECDEVIDSLGLEAREKSRMERKMDPDMNWHLYQLPAGSSVEEIVEEINQTSEEQNLDCSASPNYLTYSSGSSSWGSPHGGYGANANIQLINKPLLSMVNPSSNQTGSGATVVMFDSYCGRETLTHLQQNGFGSIEFEADYHTQPIPITPKPVNLCGHGEGVASMIKSIAPKTHLKLYRVLDDNGLGTLDGVLEALNDFAQRKRLPDHTIINLSLGVKADNGDDLLILKGVLEELYYKRNVLIVAAAGNEEIHAASQYPAAYDFVIGTAATDHHGQQASYANDGDVLAPGGDGDCGMANMPATDANFDCLAVLNSQSPTGASYWQGSSFSAGIVSGVAALLWEADGTLSPPDVNTYDLSNIIKLINNINQSH
jgi:hypothetical protein